MESRIWNIIPKPFRAKGVGVAFTIFVRALLNFAGLAALLPVLYLILDGESLHSNPTLEGIYTWLGFASDSHFVVAVALAVVLFIVAKSVTNILLYRVERDYIYALYRSLSRR
jgi:hypothetical protein